MCETLVLTALKAIVGLSSVRRPLGGTVVCSECVGAEGDEAEAGVALRRQKNTAVSD